MPRSKSASAKTIGSSGLKQALLVLSGASVMSVGVVFDANAQPTATPEAAPNVNIGSVKKPNNVMVRTPKTWQRVVIELTPEQKAQLAKAGVQTDQLKITTYNIERLAGDMVN